MSAGSGISLVLIRARRRSWAKILSFLIVGLGLFVVSYLLLLDENFIHRFREGGFENRLDRIEDNLRKSYSELAKLKQEQSLARKSLSENRSNEPEIVTLLDKLESGHNYNFMTLLPKSPSAKGANIFLSGPNFFHENGRITKALLYINLRFIGQRSGRLEPSQETLHIEEVDLTDNELVNALLKSGVPRNPFISFSSADIDQGKLNDHLQKQLASRGSVILAKIQTRFEALLKKQTDEVAHFSNGAIETQEEYIREQIARAQDTNWQNMIILAYRLSFSALIVSLLFYCVRSLGTEMHALRKYDLIEASIYLKAGEVDESYLEIFHGLMKGEKSVPIDKVPKDIVALAERLMKAAKN